jgi:hypothetical protein
VVDLEAAEHGDDVACRIEGLVGHPAVGGEQADGEPGPVHGDGDEVGQRILAHRPLGLS